MTLVGRSINAAAAAITDSAGGTTRWNITYSGGAIPGGTEAAFSGQPHSGRGELVATVVALWHRMAFRLVLVVAVGFGTIVGRLGGVGAEHDGDPWAD